MPRTLRLSFVIPLVALALLATTAARAQSLGDIARENREKAESDPSTKAPKVFTNANLPKDQDAGTNQTTTPPTSPASSTSPAGAKPRESSTPGQKPESNSPAKPAQQRLAEKRLAQQQAAEQRAAEEWKRKILQQENTVANLRMKVDKLQAAIHFSTVSTYNDMPYNRWQAQQLARLAELRQQLIQQKQRLEDLQEAARHAGMHTLVYDP